MWLQRVRALLACPDEGRGVRGNKWLILALVVCGLASACSQYNTNLTIQTSSSSIAFVSPSAAVAGGQTFTLYGQRGGLCYRRNYSLECRPWAGTNATRHHDCELFAVDCSCPGLPGSEVWNGANRRANSRISRCGNFQHRRDDNYRSLERRLFSIGSARAPPPRSLRFQRNTTSQASAPYCSAAGITLTVTAQIS